MMLYHGSFSRLIHHSKCGLWINRTRMTWEFVRNTESQAPLQTMGTRIYIFSRSTGALRSPALEDVCQGFLRRMGKGYGGNVWWRAEIRRLCLVTSAPQGEQTSKSLKFKSPAQGSLVFLIPMIRITVFRAGEDPSENIEFTALRGHCDWSKVTQRRWESKLSLVAQW